MSSSMDSAQGAAQTEASGFTKVMMASPHGDSLRPVSSVTESYPILEGKQTYPDAAVPPASAAVLEHLKQGDCVLQQLIVRSVLVVQFPWCHHVVPSSIVMFVVVPVTAVDMLVCHNPSGIVAIVCSAH